MNKREKEQMEKKEEKGKKKHNETELNGERQRSYIAPLTVIMRKLKNKNGKKLKVQHGIFRLQKRSSQSKI